MIPKIIHQTWKTRELPENLKHWHNSIIELHPGWKINLWTDEDNLELVKEHFPHLLKIYQALEYNVMRADIIRYIYMEIFGGYYVDLDYELFIAFNNEISDTELLLPISRETGKDGKITIGNCIFGSTPNHPFWNDVLDEFYKNPPLNKIHNKLKILNLTGPGFISDIYFKNHGKYNASLPSRKIFHPNHISLENSNYKELLEKDGCRGIHHCEGSWIKGFSLFNIVSRADASIKKRFMNLKKT